MTARQSAILFATFLALAIAPAINAQEIRGTVRDSASKAPLAGVVVVALDQSGDRLQRGLSDEHGRFRLPTTPSVRRVQLLRIGFRPRSIAIDPSRRLPLDVLMVHIPSLLEPIDIVVSPNCPPRPDRPAAFALWEQARTGLLASIVAREAAPATIQRFQFDRTVKDDGNEIEAMRVRSFTSVSTRAYVAAHPPPQLVQRGFLSTDGDARQFLAPDAETLLDPSFAEVYCVGLAASVPQRSGTIGVTFDRPDHGTGRIDIAGAVWIDTAARVLTDIEYRYVGLDRALDRLHLGGRIWFRTMTNGSILLDHWFIRLAGAPVDPSVRGRFGTRVVEVHEMGGEVAHAAWPTGLHWNASLGTVRGHVTRNGKAATGSIVRLIGTDYQSRVDSTGAFEIVDLVPGPYQVGVADSALADISFTMNTHTKFMAARDSTVTLSIVQPTVEAYAVGHCPDTQFSPESETGAIVGRVLFPDGTPAWRAQWQVSKRSGASWKPDAHGETDDDGMFYVCRVPRGAMLQLSIAREGAEPATVTFQTARLITAITLQLDPTRPLFP